MPFYLVRQDITTMQVDAIVNAANSSLLGGGGVDGAIHRAAGPELLEECRTLGGCRTGQAKRTGGYRLPCRYVIHTVGPVWYGGAQGEEDLLRSCYTQSLTLAAEAGCESVAFPLISAGVYGYPKQQALQVATQAILTFLQTREMTVYLTLFDPLVLSPMQDRFDALRTRLLSLREPSAPPRFEPLKPLSSAKKRPTILRRSGKDRPRKDDDSCLDDAYESDEAALYAPDHADMDGSLFLAPSRKEASLESRLSQLDESFSQMLLRLIDERGMTDAQCYKKANVDRKLFSKIRSNPQYKPSKNTAIAFAIALQLPIDQTRDLLTKAGYALSPSTKFDVIIEYCILSGNYDIFSINETLFAFDQTLLGG